jgi:lipoic acid synthetase
MSIGYPEWLSKKIENNHSIQEVKNLILNLNLNTVCQSARCPNLSDCFSHKTATFLILGNICTRGCMFCAVKKGVPKEVDSDGPKRIAYAVKKLKLNYIVITSVTRDDLKDGGAEQYVQCIKEVRKTSPNIFIEVLTPDFQGKKTAIEKLINSKPNIFAHNIETVPRLYQDVRPKANYEISLKILKTVKNLNKKILTKSGLMLGLGEREDEVIQVMYDLRNSNCDILTIGQYLRPSLKHLPIKEFIPPLKFKEYKKIAMNLGFSYVASAPLVRSSYKAWEIYEYNENKNFGQ